MVGAGDGKWAWTGGQEAVGAQRASKMETKRRDCQREDHRLLDLVEWKTVSRVILVDMVREIMTINQTKVKNNVMFKKKKNPTFAINNKSWRHWFIFFKFCSVPYQYWCQASYSWCMEQLQKLHQSIRGRD